MKKTTLLLIVSIAAGLALILLPTFAPAKAVYLGIISLTGVILAISLHVFFGYCGQINFGVAGFYLVGGYTVGLLEKYLNLPFYITLPCAMLAGGLVALIVGFPLLRLRHHTLTLGTFAFYTACYAAVSSGLTKFTGGEDGISLAPIVLWGQNAGDSFYYYLLLVSAAICCWVCYAIRHSRIGWAMLTISQDETAASTLGVNNTFYLFLALIINALMASLAGGIYVKWMGWVSPGFFSVMTNVLIFVSVLVGGLGSTVGAVVGGVTMFLLPQALLGFEKYQMLVFSVIFAFFIVVMPKGIVGFISNLIPQRIKKELRVGRL